MTNDEILKFLAQIESNGGKNFNHQMVNHGINKGTRAIGTYGLMPATVDTIVKNRPEYRNLAAMSPIVKKQYIESHPEIEKILANQLVTNVSNRVGNDPEKIAYAWNHGTNLNPNNITPELLQNDQYTNKFNMLRGKLGNNSSDLAKNIPQNEELLKKDTKNLPTIGRTVSLNDIINDPNNPYNQEDDEESLI